MPYLGVSRECRNILLLQTTFFYFVIVFSNPTQKKLGISHYLAKFYIVPPAENYTRSCTGHKKWLRCLARQICSQLQLVSAVHIHSSSSPTYGL